MGRANAVDHAKKLSLLDEWTLAGGERPAGVQIARREGIAYDTLSRWARLRARGELRPSSSPGRSAGRRRGGKGKATAGNSLDETFSGLAEVIRDARKRNDALEESLRKMAREKDALERRCADLLEALRTLKTHLAAEGTPVEQVPLSPDERFELEDLRREVDQLRDDQIRLTREYVRLLNARDDDNQPAPALALVAEGAA